MAVVIGRTSVGTTADFFASTGAGHAAWPFSSDAVGGDVHVMWCHLKVANPGFSFVQLGIYDDTGGGGEPGQLIEFASVDSITDARGTGPFSATLSTPVTITALTNYWLCIVTDGSERADFQGDSGGTYAENDGIGVDMQNPWPGNTGTSSVDIAIWGEDDAGAGDPIMDAIVRRELVVPMPMLMPRDWQKSFGRR